MKRYRIRDAVGIDMSVSFCCCCFCFVPYPKFFKSGEFGSKSGREGEGERLMQKKRNSNDLAEYIHPPITAAK